MSIITHPIVTSRYVKNSKSLDERPAVSLISLVVTLIVVGVLLWAVNTYIPMDGKIKNILNVVVVICVIVWLLYAFGIISRAGDIRVPQVR
jgi:ABC-type long-subunit fatty acid transport system fused permease/ATPase subunit